MTQMHDEAPFPPPQPSQTPPRLFRLLTLGVGAVLGADDSLCCLRPMCLQLAQPKSAYRASESNQDLSAFHLITIARPLNCEFGQVNRRKSVTDSTLRFHGRSNLTVCFPSLPFFFSLLRHKDVILQPRDLDLRRDELHETSLRVEEHAGRVASRSCGGHEPRAR